VVHGILEHGQGIEVVSRDQIAYVSVNKHFSRSVSMKIIQCI
jgi:hypothetical protein